jgi:ATP-dependent RNA helicase DDX55/SPB4
VGTIGRIYDLMEKKILNFRNLEMLIMDEADKLLEDGHEVKLNTILSALPR